MDFSNKYSVMITFDFFLENLNDVKKYFFF